MSVLVASCEGQFVKTLPLFTGSRVYGWHESFGLVSEMAMEERRKSQARRGAILRAKKWDARFKLEWQNGMPHITPLDGLKMEKTANGWHLLQNGKAWGLQTAMEGLNLPPMLGERQTDEKTERAIFIAALLLLLALMSIVMLWTPAEVVPVEELEPVAVTIEPQRTVTVFSPSVVMQQTVAPTQQKRAVHDDLGFLGLVGRKDLNKAVGGAQVNLKASAGAGAGGNAGSGGEVLAGLGKGVRATTVGNTGMQGLGGIGTKGKGGGGGGYGDVAIASGEGRGISAIAVSQGVGVDGGLDRHVIQATIAKYLSQVRACYEDRLRVNPGLEGTLAMDFEIGASGRLNYSKVKTSSVADPQVGSCVSQRMMGWEFPKPRGGVNVKVTYPFALRPVGR